MKLPHRRPNAGALRALTVLPAIVIGSMAALAGAQSLSLLAPLGTAPFWQAAPPPRQGVPPTVFSLVELDSRRALRLDADASYGNLVHEVGAEARGARHLSWRWRLDRAAAGADLRLRQGDDAAVKICSMFDLPLDRVPFLERQALRIARAAAGTHLPAATVCYTWYPGLAAQTVLPNVYTRRMRWIVLRGLGSAPGQWQGEQRDLGADFVRAFGAESADVPPLVAVLVGADADNTGGRSVAYVADLELRR